LEPRFIFWLLRRVQYTALGLIAALALSSCAAPPVTNIPIEEYPQEAVPATAAPLDSSALEEAVVEPVQAVATSRGPDLEATDPSTVNLASGQLQLVEFFRFT
jgi:hypothetical protein